MSKKPKINDIPASIEMFGRTIKTVWDDNLNLLKTMGEARYGSNEIALTTKMRTAEMSKEEIKLTYIHEMVHFILNFTGYESIINRANDIDIEQFVDLMAVGIYQALKTAEYK